MAAACDEDEEVKKEEDDDEDERRGLVLWMVLEERLGQLAVGLSPATQGRERTDLHAQRWRRGRGRGGGRIRRRPISSFIESSPPATGLATAIVAHSMACEV